MSTPDRFVYLAGTSGTATVPAGCYVTGFSCHATSAAMLVITPQGDDTAAGAAGPTITIPAGGGFSVGAPVLMGNLDELGPGSTLVFTGTDAYFVAMRQVHL